MRIEKVYIDSGGLRPVFLTTYDEHGSIETATGFLVEAKNYIALVTNWHVVSGKKRNSDVYRYGSRQPIRMDAYYYIDMGDGGNIGSHTVNIPLYKDEHNEVPNWFEHPKFGKLVDVVAIAMCTKPNDGKRPFYINFSEEQERKRWKERDVVSVVGFPHGLQIQMIGAIWTTGHIASDPNTFLKIDDEYIRAFLIDSRTRSGQSGSPVIARIEKGDKAVFNNDECITYEIEYKGNAAIEFFLGVYSGRISEEADLGYVWRPVLLREIVNLLDESVPPHSAIGA